MCILHCPPPRFTNHIYAIVSGVQFYGFVLRQRNLCKTSVTIGQVENVSIYYARHAQMLCQRVAFFLPGLRRGVESMVPSLVHLHWEHYGSNFLTPFHKTSAVRFHVGGHLFV